MAVNARGPFLCATYAIPLMREVGGEIIVNVSSINAEWAELTLLHIVPPKEAPFELSNPTPPVGGVLSDR